MYIEFMNAFEHLEDVLKLHVKENQNDTIETVEQCLSEARELALWRPILIKVNQCNVGFAMYGLWKEEGTNGRVWLDRFFIDENFQGRGYAKEILPKLINEIMEEYQVHQLFLSVYETNKPAINLYEKFGFKFNGEFDINHELVMMKEVD
ncbi:GNAT family N-acetyltransferase [Anaerorhabdus sp.]|uniref:GNAT family N-acetyltransferase n=1 Tax=Anaerorhabdus sp. TaxID=1872524 RepID=UPI002FC6913A